MTIEQKQLLYDIAIWHSKEFYNRMEDHWTIANFDFDTECLRNIEYLEAKYMDTYGDLPEWNTIDDVWDEIEKLKKELGI